MRRLTVLLLCTLAWTLGGCAGAGSTETPGTQPPIGSGGPSTPAPTAAADSESVPFTLYTHCGIHELRLDGQFFERVDGPLTDGSGNPPRGWGNPRQAGRLTVTGDVAVFTDDHGHREEFRLREGATDFLHLCA